MSAMARNQGTARRQRAVKRGLGIRVEHGQVAHFSAHAGRPLAVKVEFHAGIECQRGLPARLAAGLLPTSRRAG